MTDESGASAGTPPASTDRIVVVGAAMAGLRAAEQLRAAGWDGPLTVIGAEAHAPYNRPPLSKEAMALDLGDDLAAWHERVVFRQRASVADVEWLLGTPVVSADLSARHVDLADGRRVPYAGLVVATGLRPRRLAWAEPAGGRHVLRTLDDAVALRADLTPGAQVVVVGAGFIGCEIASTAAALGCAVTVVEPLAAPMVGALGYEVSDAIRRHHEAAGISFRLGRTVTALQPRTGSASSGADRVGSVTLDDGTNLLADVVVEAVGSHPNTEWLEGNGLDLTDGVRCDASLRVEGAEHVVAVGDIARFPDHRHGGGHRRIEHWCVPTDSAKVAARTLVTDLAGRTSGNADPAPSPTYGALPSFWSDQGELRLQSFGSTSLGDTSRVLEGDLDRPLDGVVVEYERDGALVGVLLINVPPQQYRAHRARVDQATAPQPDATTQPATEGVSA